MVTLAPGQTNPFVFVVGCPRSGTTLLQRMLNNHPDLTVANDTHFIMRAVKRTLRKQPEPFLTDELVQQVLSYHRFRRMGLEDADVAQAALNCNSYSKFVSRLYSLRAEKRGKTLSGEKSPDFCRKIPALHRLFPQAKFIHIIRDGRDTSASAIGWATKTKGPGRWSLWAQDPVASCAFWWCWQAGTGVEQGRPLGERVYHEIKYEELVADAPALLSEAADFLQIPYSEKMANYFQGRTKSNPKLSAKSAWLPPTSGLRDWRRQMKEEDLAVFEAIAGDQLQQLDYELSGAEVTETASARIKQALAWWKDQPMYAASQNPRRSE